MPSAQVDLLEAWDEVGLPHEQSKQLHGQVLPIIGFEVNVVAMTFNLPATSREQFVSSIREFVSTARPVLSVWLHTVGYINWVLNVFPWGKPALRPLYDKIKGKEVSGAKVWNNDSVRAHLEWFLRRFENFSGLFVLESLEWCPEDADIKLYTDASLEGLGLVAPDLNIGVWAELPPNPTDSTIFYFEAYAAVLAIVWAVSHGDRLRRVALYTDSENTYHMLSTLRAMEGYNDLLMVLADSALKNQFDL